MMKKLGATLAALMYTQTAEAFQARSSRGSPFVGEHADAHEIRTDDGVTLRAHPTSHTSDKYAELKSKTTATNKKTAETQIWEYLFGQSEVEQKLWKAAEQDKARQSNQSKRLRAKSFTQEVIQDQDDPLLFTAQFNVGARQKMNFIIDSATDFIAVQSEDCLDCNSKRYDISYNVNQGIATVNNYRAEIDYGNNVWAGKWGSDSFCFSIQDCYNTDLFLIEQGSKLPDPAAGIIGLAKSTYPFLVSPNEYPRNEYFLLDGLNLTQPQFATNFVKNSISYVNFGDLSSTQILQDEYNMQSFNDYFWSLEGAGVRIGSRKEDSYSFQFDAQQEIFDGLFDVYTIMDTGSSSIYISDLWYASLIDAMFVKADATYTIAEGKTYFDCSVNLPDLFFDVGKLWIQVNRKDYIVETNDGSNTCRLLVEGINAPFNIMGMPAYLDYYVVHNWENSSISFRLQSVSPKRDLEWATSFQNELPVVYATKNTANGALIATLIALFTFFLFAGSLWYLLYVQYLDGGNGDYASFAGYGAGGTILLFIGYFILRWILLFFLLPGDNVQDVANPDDAIKNVHAGHVTLFSIAAYALYRFRKAREERNAEGTTQKVESASPVEQSEPVEVVNSLE